MEEQTKNGSQMDEEVWRQADKIIAEEGEEAAFKIALVNEAKFDDADGFAAFYSLIYQRPPPRHVLKWIREIYDAHEKGEDIEIEAFRGSTKSTTMQAFLSKRIMHEPHKTNLIISAGGDDAKQMARGVADIIEHNPAWKEICPHVVPDKEGKWGEEGGYTVKDVRVDYDKWKGMVSAREGRTPTIIGVGYESTYLPGPHPTGVLLIDDYHSEKNTRTDREARKAIDIYQGTIMPMVDQDDVWFILIGTPWNYSDVMALTKTRKSVRHIFTPLMTKRLVDKGNGAGEHIEESVWPEKWTPEFIAKQRERIGSPIEWARMYDLDLEKTKGMTLKKEWLHYWEHEELLKYGEKWPVLIGVDYTSTEDPMRMVGDYFAIAVAKALPSGKGIVIFDGVRLKLPHAEAIGQVLSEAGRYLYLASLGVEAIVTGNVFYQDLLSNSELRASGISPYPVRFNKDKGYRFEKILAPLFQRGRIYLSDRADNDFLNALVDEWLNWRGNKLEKEYTNDTLDAVYALVDPPMAQQYVTPIGKEDYNRDNNPLLREKRPAVTSPLQQWSGNG